MGITGILASLYMWWKDTPHFPLGAPGVRWLLVARGLTGFFGVFGMYCEYTSVLPCHSSLMISDSLPPISSLGRCHCHHLPRPWYRLLGLLVHIKRTVHKDGANGIVSGLVWRRTDCKTGIAFLKTWCSTACHG